MASDSDPTTTDNETAKTTEKGTKTTDPVPADSAGVTDDSNTTDPPPRPSPPGS